MRCSRNALPNEDVCDVHTVQRQCVVTGCPKIANVRVTPLTPLPLAWSLGRRQSTCN